MLLLMVCSLPCRYDFFLQSPLLGATRYETEYDWGGCRIFVSSCMVEGLTCFFIEPQNGMFQAGVYTGNGDGVRFDFFCKVSPQPEANICSSS